MVFSGEEVFDGVAFSGEEAVRADGVVFSGEEGGGVGGGGGGGAGGGGVGGGGGCWGGGGGGGGGGDGEFVFCGGVCGDRYSYIVGLVTSSWRGYVVVGDVATGGGVVVFEFEESSCL